MKKARTSLFLVVALGLLALCPVGLADEFADKSVPLFCAVGWLGEFTHIDPSIGEVPPTRNDLPSTLQALAYSPDGILYAGTGNRNGLYKIDPRTGNAEYFLPTNVDIAGMAFSPSGELYVTGSSGARYLRTIDLTDGSSTSDRTLWGDRNSAQGLAFSPDGTLYAIKPNVFPGTYELLTIDLDDAQMHLLGSYSSTANVNQSITFTADGRLYAIGADAFAELNPTDGSLIGSYVTLSGDYRGLAIVPPIVYYVDADASGANNGSSWTDAYRYLQEGLAAAWSGDEIRVAQGIYKPDQGVGITPGDREATFQLISGVAIKGGYAGFGEPDPNARNIDLYETILSGDLNSDDGPNFANNTENSYHVVTGSGTDETAVIDGFTITAGNANVWGPLPEDPRKRGGGMYNNFGSPTVTNCTFTGNSADFGGGMCNEGDSSPTITNCIFSENSVDFGGGGIYCESSSPTITNCTFTSNTAGAGGGIYLYGCPLPPPTPPMPPMPPMLPPPESVGEQSSPEVLSDYNLPGPTITNCIFSENSAYRGGGMRNSNSSTTLTNCTFNGNSAQYLGGGISNLRVSDTTLANCTFTGNRAIENGGGMYNQNSTTRLVNSTYSGNWAGGEGGAICWKHLYPSSYSPSGPPLPLVPEGVFTGSTIIDSLATSDLNASYIIDPMITNCIFWNNRDNNGTGGLSQINVDLNETPIIISYSCVRFFADIVSVFGNIDTDPAFVELGYWADPNDPDIVGEPNDQNAVWIDGDYHLLPTSPCIDAGDPNYIAEPNETDLDGNARIANGIVDMGAYEHPGPRQMRQFYIDDDANGANNASSWADAFNYLQDALSAAWRGDEIWVAQGNYKPDQGTGTTPGDRTATFRLINGVTIKGGYAGAGTPDPNARDIQLYETILTGDLAGNDLDVNYPWDPSNEPTRAENSYHVVTGSKTDATAVLDGFTITVGNDNRRLYQPWNGWIPIGAGGGMYNFSGNPMVTRCTFNANSANRVGGGMYNSQSNPTLTNCTFSSNSATDGGGMANWDFSNPKLTNCTFSRNSADEGGGMYNSQSSPTLTNCTFNGNSAHYGGGMYNSQSSSTLTNCTFNGNSAHYGGGMYNWGASPILANCTFSGNRATRYCYPWQQCQGGQGGGMYNRGASPMLTNCILWGDTPQEIYVSSGTLIVTYCDVQGGRPGEGNIDADPCFADPGYWGNREDPNIVVEPDDPNAVWVDGDYHLVEYSPCIDVGDPNYIAEPNETDLDGLPRVIGGRIDMGAYEFNHIPVACIVGGDRTIEATSLETRVTLDGSCSSDVDSTPGTNDDIVSFDWYKVDACDPNFEDFLASGEIIDCNLPLGEHIIVLEVIDKAGAFDTNEVTIIVQDTTPPDFTLSVTPTMLWPANHKMVLIRPSWTASDICDDSLEVSLVSITMNEGDGRTTDDIQIGGDGSIYLRAERSGSGSGRIYTITYQAVDDSGNVAVASATVTVPHDQR